MNVNEQLTDLERIELTKNRMMNYNWAKALILALIILELYVAMFMQKMACVRLSLATRMK